MIQIATNRYRPERPGGTSWKTQHLRAAYLRAKGRTWVFVASDIELAEVTVRKYALIPGWKKLVNFERAKLVRDELELLTKDGSDALGRLISLCDEASEARTKLAEALGNILLTDDEGEERIIEGIDLDTWARHHAQLIKGEREILRDYMTLSGFVTLRAAQIKALLGEEPEQDDELTPEGDMTEEDEVGRAVEIAKALQELHGVGGATSGEADDAEDE